MKPPRPRVLFINAYEHKGGDVNMALAWFKYLDPQLIELLVVSQPHGDVYKALRSIPHAQVRTMELGGEPEVSRPQHKAVRVALMMVAAIRLTMFIWMKRIDLIYAFDRGTGLWLAYAVSLLSRCRLVLHGHQPYFTTYHQINKHIVRRAAKIVTISDFTKNKQIALGGEPQKIVKVINGIEVDLFDPSLDGHQLRSQLGISPEAPVIVQSGRLNVFKGQDDLIRAATLVLRTQPDAHFLISGSSELDIMGIYGHPKREAKEILQEAIDEYGLGGRVRLVGYVPSISEFFGLADVVVMPSWEEHWGLVALEGMAMGKPVIATKSGGVPEFIVGEETGILVPRRDPIALADAILRLLAEPQTRRRIGQNARASALKNYSAQRFARDMSREIIASA